MSQKMKIHSLVLRRHAKTYKDGKYGIGSFWDVSPGAFMHLLDWRQPEEPKIFEGDPTLRRMYVLFVAEALR